MRRDLDNRPSWGLICDLSCAGYLHHSGLPPLNSVKRENPSIRMWSGWEKGIEPLSKNRSEWCYVRFVLSG